MKLALSVAGSDCSGGAGIQADLKTFAAHGVFGASVVTAVVAENTCTVLDILDVGAEIIQKQMTAVFEDLDISSVKIGMLSSCDCMIAVAQKITEFAPKNVVIDPVMYAKNGSALMAPAAIDTLIGKVIPLAYLLTPNIPEAERLIGGRISSQNDIKNAAKKIIEMGCKSVLIKGGHRDGDAEDILFDGSEFFYFSSPRIDTKNTHGTGCTFSSAIAANLANGLSLAESVASAKKYITTAIAHSLAIGKGHGPTNHFFELYQKAGLRLY